MAKGSAKCERVKFGDMVTSAGATRKARGWNAESAGVDRYVGLEHLDIDSPPIRRWGSPGQVGENSDLRHFEPGDTILARRGIEQRKVGFATFSGVASGHALVFRARPDVVLPEFLPYFLLSDAFMGRVDQFSAGSLSKTVNLTTLLRLEFALPPLAEQQRLVTALDSAEILIAELKQAQTRADEVLRSHAHQHFAGIAAVREPLANHYAIVGGQVDPRDSAYSSLPLIAPNHIESGSGLILSLQNAAEQAAISGKYAFESGAILYSKIRPNLVKAAIAPCRGLCSADMYALVPKASLRGEYLLEILLSEEFTRFAVSGSARTGIPKLNREHLAGYLCAIPSLECQDAYLAVRQAARSAKSNLVSRVRATRSLQQNLLNKGLAHVQ